MGTGEIAQRQYSYSLKPFQIITIGSRKRERDSEDDSERKRLKEQVNYLHNKKNELLKESQSKVAVWIKTNHIYFYPLYIFVL